MIDIPAGEFIYRGLGEPPSKLLEPYKDGDYKERVVSLPAFRIDRTEVTNAAFEVFTSMSDHTNIRKLRYPDTPQLREGGTPRKPAGAVDWYDARAFCQYHGKQLPTSAQWTRTLRGPLSSDNAHPRRNFPWGDIQSEAPAKLATIGPPGPAEVGSYPLDRTVEGVMDLAGNVTEWMLDTPDGSETIDTRVARGGNWTPQGEQADLATRQPARLAHA
jgi:formylglycine-generating enzyme required for sulfatase activity